MEPSPPASVERSITPRTRRRLSFSLENTEHLPDPQDEHLPTHSYATRYSERVRRYPRTPPKEDEPPSALRKLGRPSSRENSESASKAQRRVRFDITSRRDLPSARRSTGLFPLRIDPARIGRIWSVPRLPNSWPSAFGEYAVLHSARMWGAKAFARGSRSRRWWLLLSIFMGILFLVIGQLFMRREINNQSWSAPFRPRRLAEALSARGAWQTVRSTGAGGLGQCWHLQARFLRLMSHATANFMKRGSQMLVLAMRPLHQIVANQRRHCLPCYLIARAKFWYRSRHPYRFWIGTGWISMWKRPQPQHGTDMEWSVLVDRVDRLEQLLIKAMSGRQPDSQAILDVATLSAPLESEDSSTHAANDHLKREKNREPTMTEQLHWEQEQLQALVTELRDLHRTIAAVRVDTAKMTRSLEKRLVHLEAKLHHLRHSAKEPDWSTETASDYALGSAGARIVATEPSHLMVLASHLASRLQCMARRVLRLASAYQCYRPLPYAPAIILQSGDLSGSMAPGRCWNIERAFSAVTVQLSESICPTTIALLYTFGQSRSIATIQAASPEVRLELEAVVHPGSKTVRLANTTLSPSGCTRGKRGCFCKVAVAFDPKACTQALSILRVRFQPTDSSLKRDEAGQLAAGGEHALHGVPTRRLCLYKLAVLGEPTNEARDRGPA